MSDAVLKALELVGIAVAITRLDGKTIQAIYVSERFATLIERSVDEVLAMDLSELLSDDFRPWIHELHRQWVDGTRSGERITIPVQLPSGKPLLVEMGAARVELGGDPGLVSFSVDITDREQASQSVRRSEGRFRKLVESAPDAIAIIRNGVVVFSNQAMERIPGVVVGRAWPKSPHELGNALLSDSAGRSTIPIRIALAGRLHRLLLTPVRVDFDEGPATIVFARDDTETHALQSQLLSTDRLAALGSLASGLAHNVNNPLTTVLLNLASLARDLPRLLPQGPELERSLYKVSEARLAADRVRQSMRRLRGFSAWRESPNDVDVRDVLDVVIGLVAYATPPGIDLVVDYASVPKVHAVEAGLAHAFLGLLRNALQAFPDPPPPASKIVIRVRTDDEGAVIVEISDTGVGIDEALAARIFEPFFSGAPELGRSGLGLSICRSIAVEVGGEIRIVSLADPTTIRVTLPVSLPQPVPARANKPRVLLVYANVDEASLARRSLEPELEVRQVTSSDSGLKAANEAFDLVVWDAALLGLGAPRPAEPSDPACSPTVIAMGEGDAAHDLEGVLSVAKPLNLQAIRGALAALSEAP